RCVARALCDRLLSQPAHRTPRCLRRAGRPVMLPATVHPSGLRDLAVEVASRAAELVRVGAQGGVTMADTKSSRVDVVTEIDRRSEALIRELITAARPDDAILGEEEGDTAGTSGVRWVVDPVDGTVNLLYGIGEYAVSVAAE